MQTMSTYLRKKESSRDLSQKRLKLAFAGGVAFWITDFLMAMSPIAAVYQAAFSITSLPLALVEALAGGLLIACCISYFLFQFLERLPGKNPIQKALILSFCVMAIIEVLSALANPAHAFIYLVLDTGMNIPRFLALGWTIGILFDKQNRKVLR
jgi:hypothetical protein